MIKITSDLLPKNKDGCPFLILAPMEGVGDHCFRKAMATIGGFDEAVRDFIRIPKNAHVKSLTSVYENQELGIIPLAAQLMGSDLEFMAAAAKALEELGAKRIELNCGCPSNTVTGRGAGSSLLKEPRLLHDVAKTMVDSVSIPVTVKMRSGYDDTSLFKENLLAAQESGISFLTLHPRTKADGYGPPAKWELIAEAKSILSIPLVGNGDILTPQDAANMISQTGCDALMIGRGSIVNPFLFHEIKAFFAGSTFVPNPKDLLEYVLAYEAELEPSFSGRKKINKLKQLLGYLFKGNKNLESLRKLMLTSQHVDSDEFFKQVIVFLQEGLEI